MIQWHQEVFIKYNKLINKVMQAIVQPVNIGPEDVPRVSPFEVLTMSPRDRISPYREHLNMMSLGSLDLRSWVILK